MRGDVSDRLLELTTDSENNIKVAAIYALGEAGERSSSVLERLLELSNASDNDVKISAIKALGRVSRPRPKA